MKRSYLGALLLWSISFASFRHAQGFFAGGRALLPHSFPRASTTSRWAASKRVTFQSSGETKEEEFSSNIELQRFWKENCVLYLVDQNNTQIARPTFKELPSGAKYTMVKAVKAALKVPADIPDAETREKDFSTKPAFSKVVFYNDTAGNVRSVTLANDAAYTKFLDRKDMECLINSDGNEVYSIDDLVDGATYTFGGPRGSLALAAEPQLTKPFPYDTLPPPDEVPLPFIDPMEPKFVAQDDWMACLIEKAVEEFWAGDSERPGQLVEPMALVGCSRSGKSRALREIAHRLKTTIPKVTGKPVCIIMVTFNDYSPIEQPNDKDPLQALLQRMVFEIQTTPDADKKAAYALFRDDNYYIDPSRIWRHWLGDGNAVLLIDELNNLLPNAGDTALFGTFIRSQFLICSGRYLIFSTHVLTTLESLINVVDISQSHREALLQTLPIVQNLLLARKYLNPSLQAREAVSLALLPALIYTMRYRMKVKTKQKMAVRLFNGWSDAKKMACLPQLFRSLFTGNIDHVPEPLHVLLSARAESVGDAVLWVPFYLEYLLDKLTVNCWEHQKLMAAMAKLLYDFRNAKEQSGDAWESLFCFQLIARCLAGLPDGPFVSNKWFDDPGVKVVFSQDSYQSWQELLNATKVTKEPTVFIFRPRMQSFPVYDIVLLHWKDGKLVDFYGYQLKEGKTKPGMSRSAPTEEVRRQCGSDCSIKSIWVQGEPSMVDSLILHSWIVPSENEINSFFGESGWYWTPQQWKRLLATDSEIAA